MEKLIQKRINITLSSADELNRPGDKFCLARVPVVYGAITVPLIGPLRVLSIVTRPIIASSVYTMRQNCAIVVTDKSGLKQVKSVIISGMQLSFLCYGFSHS